MLKWFWGWQSRDPNSHAKHGIPIRRRHAVTSGQCFELRSYCRRLRASARCKCCFLSDMVRQASSHLRSTDAQRPGGWHRYSFPTRMHFFEARGPPTARKKAGHSPEPPPLGLNSTFLFTLASFQRHNCISKIRSAIALPEVRASRGPGAARRQATNSSQ